MLDFRKSVAVVIGIDEYGPGITSLRTAVNDAREVAEMLETRFGYVVHRLTEDVSLERLRTLFGQVLPGEIEQDDRLLVYFAGHGIAMDGDDGPAGFLVPQDARPEDMLSFLPMAEFSGYLDHLHCRHLLLILDCCFAGAFRWSSTRDLSALPDVIHKERYRRFIEDRAWQVLTSASHDQKALDMLAEETTDRRGNDRDRPGHSPFAAALLKALEGEADVVPRAKNGQPGGDGVITATELYLYLRDSVEVGGLVAGHRQTPGLWPLRKHDKGEFIHLVDPGKEPELPPAPELTDAANPWRGLEAYDESQARLFFGRRRVIRALHRRIRKQPLTIVLGASGTGKSSLVKAGWMTRLKRIKSARWQTIPPIRPGKSPLTALAAMALPGEADGPEATAPRLAEAKADPRALASRLESWADLDPGGRTRLVIVIDQFEELLSLCWDPSERQSFLEQLQAAVAACPDRLRLVLTLRSDFEPQLADTPLKASWMNCRYVVPPMSLDEYREAIEGPASVRVLYFQGLESSQQFISRLIQDVANTPGALPLLSFALSELYRRYLARRGNDRCLTEADYVALGGVGGSLRNRAEEIFRSFGPKPEPTGEGELPPTPHQDALRRVMLRMVSVEGGDLARRRLPQAELVYDDQEENRRVADVVKSLVEARLVIPGKDEQDEPIFEPAHDELIRGWSRLQQWLRDARDSLALRQLLTPAARDWRRGQPTEDPGKLWHANPRLGLLAAELGLPHQWHRYQWQQFREVAERNPPAPPRAATWLNRDESRFVSRSLAKRHWMTSVLALTTGIVMLVLATLTGYALYSRGQAIERAEIARSRELAALAALDVGQQLDVALLLGVEAHRVRRTFEARRFLFNALVTHPGLIGYLEDRNQPYEDVAYVNDGKFLAAASQGSVTLWDAATRKRLPDEVQPRFQRGKTLSIEAMTTHPEKPLVIAASGRWVWAWDAVEAGSTGIPDASFYGYGDIVKLVCDPKGRRLAAVAERWDGGMKRRTLLMLWDVDGWRKLSEDPITSEGEILDLCFSPDGQSLALACGPGHPYKGGILIRDMSRPEKPPVHRLEVETPTDVRSVAYSPDGKTLAVGMRRRVELFEIEDWKRLEPLDPPGDISRAAFNHEGNSLAAPLEDGGGIVLWDVPSRARKGDRSFSLDGLKVSSMAFSPDGRTLATTLGSRGIAVWDASNNGLPSVHPLENLPLVYAVGFDRDSRPVAAGLMKDEKTLLALDVLTGKPVGPPFPVKEGFYGLAIGPDATRLAGGFFSGDGELLMVDVPNGTRLDDEPIRIPGDSVHQVKFSPDGRRMATIHNRAGLALWDRAAGRRLADLPLADPEDVRAVAFSPDGRTLALVDSKGLWLWDLDSRRRLSELPLTASSDIAELAFSPDGEILCGVVNERDQGAIAFWDIASQRPLSYEFLTFTAGSLEGVALSPDGRSIAANGLGLVALWNVGSTPEIWKQLARRIVMRNFTWGEWQEYFGRDVPYHRTFEDLPDGDGVEEAKKEKTKTP